MIAFALAMVSSTVVLRIAPASSGETSPKSTYMRNR